MNIRWRRKSPAPFHPSNIFMRNATTLSTNPGFVPPWIRPEQNLIRPQRETESTRQLSCDVVFGSPSADCMGTGVCRISARTAGSPSAGDRKRSCRSTAGLLFPIEGGHGISMVLTRALLCTQLYKTHLRHGTLSLESPCPLPKEVIRPLGLKITELPVGKYRIRESQGFIRIDFKTLELD